MSEVKIKDRLKGPDILTVFHILDEGIKTSARIIIEHLEAMECPTKIIEAQVYTPTEILITAKLSPALEYKQDAMNLESAVRHAMSKEWKVSKCGKSGLIKFYRNKH